MANPNAVGGLKTPISTELLEQAKELYLQGLSWPKIAEITGLKAASLSVMASVKGWTATKAEQKAKAELDGLRPKLHGKLTAIVDAKPLQKAPTSLRQAQAQADLIHTVTQSAKEVEGWAPSAGNTLVNVAVLNDCIIRPTVAPVTTEPVIDVPCEPAKE